MKRLCVLVALMGFASAGMAQVKPCEELKQEIEAKIQANGVTQYTLEIVEKGQEAGLQTVGSCDGGQRVIVYQRG
ncbi:DUF1161 domain-containing protein [Pseudomonas matsuisoli]|uniref:DUF1161 domain-containing protein n=1 Tax=Pseudomonas matsuisoli TaxID=1515666 RepID=A0A917PWR3_9PSED|nr:DUF1161 domain-containing protein [Pseudomonas matsuisoli]GGJ95925.1 hypothetical protein GCM10009304_22330 [Pseudomonas matsuisoli]